MNADYMIYQLDNVDVEDLKNRIVIADEVDKMIEDMPFVIKPSSQGFSFNDKVSGVAAL